MLVVVCWVVRLCGCCDRLSGFRFVVIVLDETSTISLSAVRWVDNVLISVFICLLLILLFGCVSELEFILIMR